MGFILLDLFNAHIILKNVVIFQVLPCVVLCVPYIRTFFSPFVFSLYLSHDETPIVHLNAICFPFAS